MEKNLTSGSVLKSILFFSLPYLLSYFLQTLYGMADLFIIGQFEGVASTTAVSIGSQVMHMITVMILSLIHIEMCIRDSIGRSLCSAAAGMVLYFLLTKLIVWACGWQMASYNGGADVSVLSILKNLPNAIAETYQLFGAYFFQNYYRHNILQPVGFFVLVFLALSIELLNRFRKILHQKNWEYILLGVAALIVLPIMCNAIMLITSERCV